MDGKISISLTLDDWIDVLSGLSDSIIKCADRLEAVERHKDDPTWHNDGTYYREKLENLHKISRYIDAVAIHQENED